MSLELFGYKSIREKVSQEKKWANNNFRDCPLQYHPESPWLDNAKICRLSLLIPYCETFGIYQILNKEFNDSLAAEIKKLRLKPVLVTGAGSGDVAVAMRRRGIDAVDLQHKHVEGSMTNPQPENIDYAQAVKKYHPQLIICIWLPAGENWASVFNASAMVQACITIGDEDKNMRGEFQGWESKVLKEPNKWSLCRLDHGVDFEKPELWCRHSKVILYSKNK